MEIETFPIERLIPYARNPRRNAEAIAKVAASIKEFGFRQPIVVDDGMVVIVGHTRLEAAKSLGIKKVPVHIAKGLTEEQVSAYRLADNRTNEEAEWDIELLRQEVTHLESLGFDISVIGFDAADLNSIFLERSHGETNADEEWTGMPEFDQQDKRAFRTLHVHFATDKDVKDFAELVNQTITEKTRFLWYPNIVIETYADKRYESPDA